jgi:predicted kinase
MRTVMIYRGLPGSGKSSVAKKLIQKEPNRWARINRDDLRSMFNNSSYSPSSEEFVRKVRDQLILSSLRDGFDVIIDDTNLVSQTVRKIHKLLASVGDVKAIEVPFNESIAECVRRNELREGKAKVPKEIIHKMAKAAGLDKGRVLEAKEFYYPPREQATDNYIANETLPKAIVCDLDGTLAIMGNRSPFDASECDIKDSPNKPVVACVKAMYAAGYAIVFMSGRESKDREPSTRQIESYLPGLKYELYMRATADSRKDSIIKTELFDANVRDKYNIEFILDDRNQVVQDCWRAMGMNCFQVADGNF